MLVEKKGTPRCALVEPSIGSITASSPEPPSPVAPDSSENTVKPAPCNTGRAAPSAARSRRYWPGFPPLGPQSSSTSSAPRTARTASSSTARRRTSSTGDEPYRALSPQPVSHLVTGSPGHLVTGPPTPIRLSQLWLP